ncbi:MAG: type II toxin-antitoxin system antitoxin SocA domain-containing protein [Patescibacteria group bacterium]
MFQPTKQSASVIAKYFLWKTIQDKKSITNKKLQKLLYYSQAWNLAFNNTPLFKEKIEAWIHGPAIRSVYRQYKKFGFGPIRESVSENDFTTLTADNKDLLDEIWRVYGKFDASYLEELTHGEEPWQKARENLDGEASSTNIISLENMQIYYRKLGQKKDNGKE